MDSDEAFDQHLEMEYEDRVSGEAEDPIWPDPDPQEHDNEPLANADVFTG